MTPIARIVLLLIVGLAPFDRLGDAGVPDRPSSSLSILSTSNIQGYVSKL
jgi:hypothetical protein